MPTLKNDHCRDCNSRTKLLLKAESGFRIWCSIAKKCPYSQPNDLKGGLKSR